MNLLQLVHAALPISILLIVLSLGLRCTLRDATFLFREPRLLARSLLAMHVVVPVVTALIVAATDVSPAVKIALVVMAASPVPPILPGRELKLVTRESYVYGLLVATSLLSIVIVPVTMTLLGAAFGREVHVSPGLVARAVFFSVFAPLAMGIALQRLWPSFAAKAAPALNATGMLLLLAAGIVVLVAGWSALRSLIGDGTLLACVGFTAVGLLVGHVLGGPDADDRTVLALGAATRHPGVAIPIAAAVAPDEKLVPLVLVLALLVGSVASTPYSSWRKRLRRQASA